MDSGLSSSSQEENIYVPPPPQAIKCVKKVKKLPKKEERSYVTPAYRVRF